MIKQLQRAVAAFQIGGLFRHPVFQIVIQLGHVFRHRIECFAETTEFIITDMQRAYPEIAAPEIFRAGQKFAQRNHHVGIHHIHRDRHHDQDKKQRDTEYGTEQGNAVLRLQRQQVHQAIYFRYKGVDLVQ